MWAWLAALSRPRGERCLRAVVPPGGDPYREPPIEDFAERSAEASTLSAVLAAMRADALNVRARRRGFDVIGPSRSRILAVRVDDPARVTPGTMSCDRDAPELRIDLALALVPVFGALLVDVPLVGEMFVDGARDRRTVGEDAAQRLQEIGRRVAKRAPFSFPLLVELAHRLRGAG